MVGGLEDRQVKYLGATHEGKKHDQKIGDAEGTAFPDGIDLYRDTAYQGHELPNVTVHQPKKKPRNGKLSDEDKAGNRLISSIRVVIEHLISGIKRAASSRTCSGTPRRGTTRSRWNWPAACTITGATAETKAIDGLSFRQLRSMKYGFR